MIQFIIVLFLIPYNGDAQKVETGYYFDTPLECQRFVMSKEYRNALKIEYQGKGIINVTGSCERRFIDTNYQKTGI